MCVNDFSLCKKTHIFELILAPHYKCNTPSFWLIKLLESSSNWFSSKSRTSSSSWSFSMSSDASCCAKMCLFVVQLRFVGLNSALFATIISLSYIWIGEIIRNFYKLTHLKIVYDWLDWIESKLISTIGRKIGRYFSGTNRISRICKKAEIKIEIKKIKQ